MSNYKIAIIALNIITDWPTVRWDFSEYQKWSRKELFLGTVSLKICIACDQAMISCSQFRFRQGFSLW